MNLTKFLSQLIYGVTEKRYVIQLQMIYRNFHIFNRSNNKVWKILIQIFWFNCLHTIDLIKLLSEMWKKLGNTQKLRQFWPNK